SSTNGAWASAASGVKKSVGTNRAASRTVQNASIERALASHEAGPYGSGCVHRAGHGGCAAQAERFCEVASGEVAGRYFAQRRTFDLANILGVLAARVKVAARRRIGRAGHLAGQLHRAAAQARVGRRD